ncbi:hypothetical protein BCR32DRAFT_275825 [Anaeromyces robustus]|uniref:Uncharacterized protein n=1 Tax=Anaeromyces robustus TaxID=1754192 RepID=A0A1Y1XJS2_9FUNG|nr:hypothetical protein BCR32DRAFT_275825 [Anaeromyces robustus]|eukprot:ORX85998.1 hypothetical protein BCR32DRAFT_275825 [Anaeromyces robustus]
MLLILSQFLDKSQILYTSNMKVIEFSNDGTDYIFNIIENDKKNDENSEYEEIIKIIPELNILKIYIYIRK